MRLKVKSITKLADYETSKKLTKLTCKIVSKLNVRPFHSVNSPELAPVISLRPSGVHASVKIGHLILLVAVLTNLVVIALLGFS